jgi:KDO2-lipid IV(A) lauroyltransferase
MTATGTSGTGRRGLGSRIAARLLLGGVAVLQRLPDRPVYSIGFRAGRVASRLMARRRDLARANLARVCRALDANGTASARVRAAARDERVLDDLVRDVFGHWFVAYLEGAIASRYDAATIRRRIHLADPDLAAAALTAVPSGSPGPIFAGLHLGSVEMAGMYAARTGSMRIAGPMEQLRDPVLAEYFRRTRGAIGFDLIPIRDASTELRARIRRGDGAALVADRPIGGAGTSAMLFGAPCRLPAGPAVLAVETGAPLYVLAVLRRGSGDWDGYIERIEVPSSGTRHERVRTTLGRQVGAFERLVARAPEQWWTLLFRIWEDIPQA